MRRLHSVLCQLTPPCSRGISTQPGLVLLKEPVGGVSDPVGPLVVGRDMQHTLVPQLPHVDLQGEQSQHHQAEDGQHDGVTKLFHGLQQGVDDYFQT